MVSAKVVEAKRENNRVVGKALITDSGSNQYQKTAENMVVPFTAVVNAQNPIQKGNQVYGTLKGRGKDRRMIYVKKKSFYGT
jgi:hypothetical protein